MLFTIKELKQIFHTHHTEALDSLVIERVTTDSRQKAAHALFIPIIGENFNGHDYVEQAIEHGAKAIVWDELEELPLSISNNFPVFFTDDTTKALQQLAAYYRKKVNPKVIGITGSNGKTTTKDLVASVTRTVYPTHATIGNLNNHIGLPLTILDMPQETEVLVLEMGMSDFGEIKLLSDIAAPDYAIITNIGESHIEFLGSKEGIAKAKLEITSGLKENGTLVIDGDEVLLKEVHKNKAFHTLRCGFKPDNNMQITGTEISVQGTAFQLSDPDEFTVPLHGEHHAKNAAYAVQIGKLLNIPSAKIKKGLQDVAHTSMRFELMEADNGAMLVNDSYNASPTSMKGAIGVMKRMDGFTDKILVLGDVLELGPFAEEMHRSVADEVTPPITYLYTYGEKAQFITEEVKKKSPSVAARHFASKETLAEVLAAQLTPDSIVLFKASRGLEFETIIENILVKQQHEEQ